MPDLNFEIASVEVPAFAATPTLIFKLRIDNAIEQENVHTVILRCQIQLNVTHRRYSREAQAKLLEIFGEPERWGQTLHPFLWTHASAIVPQFSGHITVDLPVPCTYDFEVVSTKYFNALGDGEIPLLFLFSGTIFYEGKAGENEAGRLQVAQISWSKEATFRLPVEVWQTMIAQYYPNSTWLRLHKDVFDQLYAYKARQGLPTWDDVLTRLLQTHNEAVQP
jgi:hypothetical protein